VYEIQLKFAEVATRKPNTRFFDVVGEGQTLLARHDIPAEVGSFAADDHTFFVSVTDGQLNLRFVTRRGSAQPIVNAIRVTNRPDH
jgi:Malectin domain